MQLYVAYAWYAEDQTTTGHGYCILNKCPMPMDDKDIEILIQKIRGKDELDAGIIVPVFWTQLPGKGGQNGQSSVLPVQS
jgi:hypothetical protein